METADPTAQRSMRFALTPLQKGLLAESLVASDRGANVEQIVWELDHVPASDRLRAAWQTAVDEFDALRLAFAWPGSGGEPHQTVLPTAPVPFRRVDGPERTPAERRDRLEAFLEEDRRAGFDLLSAPPMRVSLLVLGASLAFCVWTIHHTIIDGNCYATVLQRVLDGYAAPAGAPPAPAPTRPPFTAFLRWLERHDPTPGAEHFAALLRGLEAATPLPLQQGEVRTAANRSSQVVLRLDRDAAERLRELARDTGATPNTLVQLAWALLLSRYSGEDDVLFGATWSGRVATLGEAARAVGPLINTLPVRARLGEAATVRELIASLRRQHLAVRPFQQTAAGRIKAESALASSAHLYSTVVLYERSRFHSVLREQDVRWRGHQLWSRSQANVPLVLAAYSEDGALVLELEYDLGLYTEAGARTLLADYARILTALGEDLDRSPLRVPMLDAALRARLTTAEAERERPPGGPSVIERVLERASRTPDATAAKALAGSGVSYAELARRVSRLSGVLRARGVGPGALVGVLLRRSIDAVASLLAVHAAGGAFVPLDPGDPVQRLEFMVKDSAAKLVLVDRHTRGRVPGAADLELDVDGPEVARAPDAGRPPVFPAPASPAYVIYTSGSTGEPKGVCVSHGALANHVSATLDRFALRPEDRVLQFTAPTFDVCLEEILPTLVAGATLVLRDDAMTTTARGFLDAVLAGGLTVLNLPTSFWHQLVRAEHVRWPSCLRLVVVGGEQVSSDAHRRFRAADTGHIRWINAYGPTEATITSTSYDDAEGDHAAGAIPIGRPLPGVSHFVLDEHMRPAPVGQPGQLYIGGAGLALGYVGRGELTRRRFVEHPFRPGARLYATGDRVRMTEAGNYVYLGRLDEQIKIRGFRVECGEIEARLRQHPAVAEAAVVVHERDGSPVAFAVADPLAASPAQLREHVAAALPSYMVPPRIVVAKGLPVTSSGKIDRRALARLDVADHRESGPGPVVAVDDPLLRILLDTWSLLLGAPVTDPSASFFALGGDSLLVVQMFTEIEVRLGRTCDAPAFLRDPTIANLASLLRSAPRTDWSAPVSELARGEPGVRPLFLAPGLCGRGFDYVHLAEALSSELPVYALQTPALARPEAGRETLREVARVFASRIREVQRRGPYAVAGFSAGGVAAMAIAEELRTMGQSTDFVGIIDSVPPRSVPVPSPFGSPRRLARLARTVLGRVRESLSGPDGGPARLWARTRSALLRAATRWEVVPLRHEPSLGESFTDVESKLSDGERERMRRYFEAIWNHEFRGMPIDVVLFRVELDPFEGPHEPQLGWQRVTSGTIAVEYVPGSHQRVLTQEGSRDLAPRLDAYLKRRAAAPTNGAVRPVGATAPPAPSSGA